MGLTPAVSVVIPLYKEFNWLGETLRSLQACGLDNWEAVLVNDGSPADPIPAVSPFLKDERFQYLQKAHGGIAAARNFGVRGARAEWLAFLDQDDRVLPGRFESQLALTEGAHENLAVVYSDYERIDESGGLIDRFTSRECRPQDFIAEELSDRGPFSMGTALIRRRWIERAGGFDAELPGYDETDLAVRIAVLGGVFRYAPGVVHQWRDHGGNTMKSREFQIERRLKFLSKMESLSGSAPPLAAALPRLRALEWHNVGLYSAQTGEWRQAAQYCWKAWRQDPSRWSALYLAAKSRLMMTLR